MLDTESLKMVAKAIVAAWRIDYEVLRLFVNPGSTNLARALKLG